MILFVFNYDITSDKSYKDFYLTYVTELCKQLPEKEDFKLHNHSKLHSLELIKAECKLLPKSRTTRELTTLAVLGISAGVTLLCSSLHALWEWFQQKELKEGMTKLVEVVKNLENQTQALSLYSKELKDYIFLLQNFHDRLFFIFDIDFTWGMLLILQFHILKHFFHESLL